MDALYVLVTSGGGFAAPNSLAPQQHHESSPMFGQSHSEGGHRAGNWNMSYEQKQPAQSSGGYHATWNSNNHYPVRAIPCDISLVCQKVYLVFNKQRQ